MKKWKLVAVTQLLLLATWLVGASPSLGANTRDAKGPACVEITDIEFGRVVTDEGVPRRDQVRVVVLLADPSCANAAYLVELWEANAGSSANPIGEPQSPDATITHEIDQDGDGDVDDRTGELRFDFIDLPLTTFDDRLCVQSQTSWEKHVADYSPDLVGGQRDFSADGGVCMEVDQNNAPSRTAG